MKSTLMFRMVTILSWCLLFGTLSATTENLDNRRFCERALSLVADSLLDKLALDSTQAIWPMPSGDENPLAGQMVQRLHERGFNVYLGETPASESLQLDCELSNLKLEYQGVSKGLFRQGEVKRVCTSSGKCSLIGLDGRLLKQAQVPLSRSSDTISFAEAEAACVGQGIYAPALPPSVFQRVVEPTLVVGITGTLVYLFFASR